MAGGLYAAAEEGLKMAHHKRRRPKNCRAGCLLCKPWKVNGVRTERTDAEKFSDHRRRVMAAIEIDSYWRTTGARRRS